MPHNNAVTTIRSIRRERLRDVYAIDMREIGETVYHVVDGRLIEVQEAWSRPPRSRESWDQRIGEWEAILDEGGAAWGAYDGEAMVGIIVLRPRLTEGMAQLVALYVSRDYRRSGVARRLAEELIAAARASGAHRIYVSSVPSRSAVGFYSSLGFRLAETVHPALFELEPEDVHMILEL